MEEVKKFKCPKCGGNNTVPTGTSSITYTRKPIETPVWDTKIRECRKCGHHDSEDKFSQNKSKVGVPCDQGILAGGWILTPEYTWYILAIYNI